MTARPDVFHVDVTSRRGEKVEGIYQFHEREDAESFAATMNDQGYTTEITPGPLKTQFVKASRLHDNDRLANGSVLISHMYFGLVKIRVTGIRIDGPAKIVRRSYEPDQLVEIEAR